MAKSIAIVGAGAKAAAIAARAAVLKDVLTDGTVPTIYVIEEAHVGAAWSGRNRFSSGFLTLCTPGEKDVGFPYSETIPRGWASSPVSPALFARFSWPAYQVATGGFSEWVDRGRDHPIHRQWTEYLEWVFETAGQKIVFAKVTEIRRTGSRWQVTFEDGGKTTTKMVDGVVLTGAGTPREILIAEDVPADRVFDSETFWMGRDRLRSLGEETVAVAGDGGAAGTIVSWLAEQLIERPATIASINPMGTLFPRGDGYAERRWFSDPSLWIKLKPEDRQKLLDRTEAGVVSLRLKRNIDLSRNVKYFLGKAVGIRWDAEESNLQIDIDYDGEASCLAASYFVNAIGFDSWSRLSIVSDDAVVSLLDPVSSSQRETVEATLCDDLSLPHKFGLPPSLHVPMLAGLAHGPGMGNLGCLGLMAKAILDPYCLNER